MRNRKTFIGAIVFLNIPNLPALATACLAGSGDLAASEGQDTLKTRPLPTVQQVLDRYVRALGGREVILGHKSMTVRMELAVPGKDLHLDRVVYFKGDKSREELTLADGRRYQSGYDGKIAWEINPNTGAALIQGDQAMSKARDADMYYPTHILDYFKSMEVADIAEFDGHTCYHLKGTNKWGKVNEHFYDTTTGLLAGYRFSSAWRGGAGDESVVFSDYKDFGGWMMPARIEHKESTRTVTETVGSVAFDSVADSDVRLPDAVKTLLREKH